MTSRRRWLQREMDALVQAGWASEGAAGEAAAPPEAAAGETEEQRSAGDQEQQLEEKEQIDEVDDDSQPADAGCEAQQVDVDVGEKEYEADELSTLGAQQVRGSRSSGCSEL